MPVAALGGTEVRRRVVLMVGGGGGVVEGDDGDAEADPADAEVGVMEAVEEKAEVETGGGGGGLRGVLGLPATESENGEELNRRWGSAPVCVKTIQRGQRQPNRPHNQRW